MLDKYGQHYSSLGFKIDQESMDKLIKKLNQLVFLQDLAVAEKETVDKPKKPSKLAKQKQTIPFWATDYRRK